MTIRFENAARYAVSLVGALGFTAILIANTLSMGPVA